VEIYKGCQGELKLCLYAAFIKSTGLIMTLESSSTGLFGLDSFGDLGSIQPGIDMNLGSLPNLDLGFASEQPSNELNILSVPQFDSSLASPTRSPRNADDGMDELALLLGNINLASQMEIAASMRFDNLAGNMDLATPTLDNMRTASQILSLEMRKMEYV
jgi:hypothetical protein